jgi:hypothetical protein
MPSRRLMQELPLRRGTRAPLEDTSAGSVVPGIFGRRTQVLVVVRERHSTLTRGTASLPAVMFGWIWSSSGDLQAQHAGPGRCGGLDVQVPKRATRTRGPASWFVSPTVPLPHGCVLPLMFFSSCGGVFVPWAPTKLSRHELPSPEGQ